MRIQFSHGNGFPAGSYRGYLDALRGHRPDATIAAVERIGHDPRYPITDSWPHLVDELVAQLDGDGRPNVLIGHSLGGFLSLMAAYSGKVRVDAVVLLDSPIVPGWKAKALVFAKRTGLDEHFSPAGSVKRRRDRWPDRATAHAHLRDKPLFARFDDAAFSDYIAAGIVDADDGATLAFEREREYRIFRTLPHHLHRLVRKGAPFPVGFIGGTQSVELRMTGMEATRRLVGGAFRTIEAGHLFPLERPHEAAATTHALLGELLPAGAR